MGSRRKIVIAVDKNKRNHPLEINFQLGDASVRYWWSTPAVKRWVRHSLAHLQECHLRQITVRIVDEVEALTLNRNYRQKNYATNVLTFCYWQPQLLDKSEFERKPLRRTTRTNSEKEFSEMDQTKRKTNVTIPLNQFQIDEKKINCADIVICHAVVLRESLVFNRPFPHHAIRMLVHGVLHAAGFDHEEVDDAVRMEAVEREILGSLYSPE